jgi:hypothetical protein
MLVSRCRTVDATVHLELGVGGVHVGGGDVSGGGSGAVTAPLAIERAARALELPPAGPDPGAGRPPWGMIPG